MSYIGYNVYAAPGYEAVSTAYLSGLKETARTLAKTTRELEAARVSLKKVVSERDALGEEIGELKDLLKQVLRQAHVREHRIGLPAKGEELVRHYVLGERADLRIEIEKASGRFGEANGRRIKVWVPKPVDPDEPIVSALSKEYPFAAKDILGAARRAGLDITLKGQGKAATNADATSLTLVS